MSWADRAVSPGAVLIPACIHRRPDRIDPSYFAALHESGFGPSRRSLLCNNTSAIGGTADSDKPSARTRLWVNGLACSLDKVRT